MALDFCIGPTIGIARLGNSDRYFLAPDDVGALPIQCVQATGNPFLDGRRVERFKECRRDGSRTLALPRLLRQAARYTVFVREGEASSWRRLRREDGVRVEWTVRLANKKAAAPAENGITHDRTLNRTVPPPRSRRSVDDALSRSQLAALVLDTGIVAIGERRHPGQALDGRLGNGWRLMRGDRQVDHVSLGRAWRTDDDDLVVLGGRGADYTAMHADVGEKSEKNLDDTSDGPVVCTLRRADGKVLRVLRAWCIVAPPKYAPEIPNLVTLADVMHDAAVRLRGEDTQVHRDGAFAPDYRPNLDRDIRPILERPALHRWITGNPAFGTCWPEGQDPGRCDALGMSWRRATLALFRSPSRDGEVSDEHRQVFRQAGPATHRPLWPLLAGDQPSSDARPPMFLSSITPTQHFMLSQWAAGKVDASPPPEVPLPMRLTLAHLGNCGGAPFSPGIETSWNVRDPDIYEAPFTLRHARPSRRLSHDRDEVASKSCQAGDMTKRLRCPWWVDIGECMSTQRIGFSRLHGSPAWSELSTSQDMSSIPPPPQFEVYWWPPQVPVRVVSLSSEHDEQWGRDFRAYMAGASDRLRAWTMLPFVVNQTRGPLARQFPFFAAQEHVEAPTPTRVHVAPDVVDQIRQGMSPDGSSSVGVDALRPYVQTVMQVMTPGSPDGEAAGASHDPKATPK